MASNAIVMAIVNQKGGVGKTTSTMCLGAGLVRAGKKVLLIDADPQASLTISMGLPYPDDLEVTLSDIMMKLVDDQPVSADDGIFHHSEGMDLMPANITLSGLELSLVNVMSRETILRQYIEIVRDRYDYILLDCQPSLGLLTINCLAASDKILIPVQAEYLPAKGLEQLLSTVGKVRRQINPKLEIDGIFLTMVDSRTTFAKEVSAMLHETYESDINIYASEIPNSVRAKEISAAGTSIFAYDPNGKVAHAYSNLVKEVLNHG